MSECKHWPCIYTKDETSFLGHSEYTIENKTLDLWLRKPNNGTTSLTSLPHRLCLSLNILLSLWYIVQVQKNQKNIKWPATVVFTWGYRWGFDSVKNMKFNKHENKYRSRKYEVICDILKEWNMSPYIKISIHTVAKLWPIHEFNRETNSLIVPPTIMWYAIMRLFHCHWLFALKVLVEFHLVIIDCNALLLFNIMNIML